MTKGHCNGQSKHAPVKKSRGGATLAPRGQAQPPTHHTHPTRQAQGELRIVRWVIVRGPLRPTLARAK